MSEAKHTPGPWTTDEDDHDAPHQNIKVKAGKHHTVCTVWIDDAPVRDFNSAQQANARLVVAAPELLEALQRIIAAANTSTNDAATLNWIADTASAAIAKATNQ